MFLKYDCRYFRADIPCTPHKKSGVHCENCNSYERIEIKILLIKLGAAGDVIRTTPIISKIKKIYPSAYIVWLTDYPELVPKIVDERLIYDLKLTASLQNN